MNQRALRAVSFAGVALAIALVGAACNSTVQPTPIYVTQTPTPTATTGASATATPEATPEASFTPWPSLAPTPPPTTPPTAAPTTAPSAGPTSPASFCTGGAANQPEFVKAAKTLKFAVYCATLGKGWGLTSSPGMSWAATKSGGWITITYKGPGTAKVDVAEGSFCLTSALVCAPNTGNIGTGSFGGLSGALDSTTDGFAIYVAPGTAHAYKLVGHNVTQAILVSIGAGLKVIPKS